MNTRRFFEAMNEVSDKYYEEASKLCEQAENRAVG